VKSYRDLLVWQAAITLALDSYSLTSNLPKTEMYGLTSQIRRSSTSIAANIAEGYGRENRGSFVQFLRIAQGSLKELETHFIISGKLKFANEQIVNRLLSEADELGKMLHALIRSLQRKG
jgi:four helix bundle protein